MSRDCADCENCPLRSHWKAKGHWSPVTFEENKGDILILGDAPSKQDARSSTGSASP